MDSASGGRGIKSENTSELSAELSRDGRAVRELRARHSSISSSKFSLIKQLREINSQFSQSVGRISELRSARDRETASVKELKAKRQEANEAVRAISPEMKKALDAKETAVGSLSKAKGGSRKSASQLYSDMEALEMRIITEAMPFSKEQEIMKVIGEKRQQLEAVKAFSEALKSHKELFSRFSELRRQSYAFHTALQKHAADSQKFHEEMIGTIEKVKQLRHRKNGLLEQLHKIKADYSAAHTQLQQKLHGLAEAKRKLDTLTAAKQKEIAERKEQELTDKLKSGKKLTAKDLIMLQDR